MTTTNSYWVAAALSPEAGSGGLAHVDGHVLSAVDGSGLAADLVCTHIDHSGPIAAITASARVHSPIHTDALQALAHSLGGSATAIGPSGERLAASSGSAGGDVAARAALAARAGLEGRCVRFPGQLALTGVHPVAQLTASSAIDDVLGVGPTLAPEMLVDTRGFLRPQFQQHRLVLLVEPAAGGALRPVELENPHECCGGH